MKPGRIATSRIGVEDHFAICCQAWTNDAWFFTGMLVHELSHLVGETIDRSEWDVQHYDPEKERKLREDFAERQVGVDDDAYAYDHDWDTWFDKGNLPEHRDYVKDWEKRHPPAHKP